MFPELTRAAIPDRVGHFFDRPRRLDQQARRRHHTMTMDMREESKAGLCVQHVRGVSYCQARLACDGSEFECSIGEPLGDDRQDSLDLRIATPHVGQGIPVHFQRRRQPSDKVVCLSVEMVVRRANRVPRDRCARNVRQPIDARHDCDLGNGSREDVMGDSPLVGAQRARHAGDELPDVARDVSAPRVDHDADQHLASAHETTHPELLRRVRSTRHGQTPRILNG